MYFRDFCGLSKGKKRKDGCMNEEALKKDMSWLLQMNNKWVNDEFSE